MGPRLYGVGSDTLRRERNTLVALPLSAYNREHEMPYITDPANPEPSAGKEFNYAVWAAGTKLTLVNVPWNNDYRDIVKFPQDDGKTLNQYIDEQSTAGLIFERMSYVKPNEPIRVKAPFNTVYTYNYLRASNPVQPVPGNDEQRDIYYFITDVRYVAPNTTELVLQVDVWQTFGSYATFGNCYIERGHIGIANENKMSNYGRDYLTIPEGLDVGGEMQIIDKASKPIMSYDNIDPTSGSENYNILVISTTDLLADPGTAAAPKLNTAQGGAYWGLPSGANQYVFGDYVSLRLFLSSLSDKPWITQGIVSITAIPPIKYYDTQFPGWPPIGDPNPRIYIPTATTPLTRTYPMYPGWRNSDRIQTYIPERYRTVQAKLFTFPYMAVELTMFTGTPVLLKPESWATDDADVLDRVSFAPPNQRVVIGPRKYNALPGSPTDDWAPGIPHNPGTETLWFKGDDWGEYLDISTQMNNFPSFAVVNNGALSYLAANAHGIAYQYQSADWAATRALHGNAVSYDQASAGMQLASNLTNIGINADQALTGIQNTLAIQKAVLGGIGDVAGGISGGAAGIAGGAAAAATRGISTAMDVNASQQSLGVRNNAARSSTGAQVANQGYVRDTNRDLADWSARGDYMNAIAATNAKVQDAKLIQPTTSGQVGGEALNIVNNNAVISMRIKMIDHAAMANVCEYWLRYGYSVRRFGTIPASLQVMTKFTYWKLMETYISASAMPESYKQVIRGIFEKGVTVWARPEYIGVTDTADNQPLPGVTL